MQNQNSYTLFLENFRCFRKRQEAAIAPITILMGDNSSGKSSFLAGYKIAASMSSGALSHNFNESPFILGAFDQIAHSHGGKTGRAKDFMIGLKWKLPQKPTPNPLIAGEDVTIEMHFAEYESQPRVHLAAISTSLSKISVAIEASDDWTSAKVHLKSTADDFEIDVPARALQNFGIGYGDFAQILFFSTRGKEADIKHRRFAAYTELVETLAYGLHPSMRPSSPSAFSPVRTHPRRTYDSVKEDRAPEGDHVPFVLARSHSKIDKRDWKALKDALERFGQASGLFKHIQVKSFGKKPSGPFQIKITVDGPPANLIDVGYGISQSLPLIVDILLGRSGSTFLVQQPEVHLHPRAQAELGSFFSALAHSESKRFLIETHSDHLLDRIRLEVRRGTFIKKEDVSILYLERRKAEVGIQKIELDDMGNIVHVPKGYRRFFLEEERKIMGL